MKLVDILARDMSKWPEELECLSQLRSGYIINGKGFDGRAIDVFQVAEETRVAGVIVTRAQWQEARDALANPKQVQWNGDGLPPVGTVCEYKRGSKWEKVEVFAVKPNVNGSTSALFTYECGTWTACAEPSFFRPIRTPEQIAAEEREQAIAEMAKTVRGATGFGINLAARAALYDAGYRKQKDA